jgi:NDP-sugar pyrophosphorylase family protein
MKTLLICPSERPAVRHLSAMAPLACVPLLGQSLVEYWLSHLAAAGAKQVLILAADRPEHVLALVGNGARWGLIVDVIPESRELTPPQASLKYAAGLDPVPAQVTITALDRLPGHEHLLFESYVHWFEAACAWMPRARTPERVGLQELQPGVWVGQNTRIAPGARLQAPCWLGQHVFVGPQATIGPRVVLEDGVFVEPLAEITDSYVGPHTLVGQFTRLHGSLALANTLIDCQSGLATDVLDPFLLTALRPPRRVSPASPWLTRLLELCFRKREEFQVLSKHLSMDRKG